MVWAFEVVDMVEEEDGFRVRLTFREAGRAKTGDAKKVGTECGDFASGGASDFSLISLLFAITSSSIEIFFSTTHRLLF